MMMKVMKKKIFDIFCNHHLHQHCSRLGHSVSSHGNRGFGLGTANMAEFLGGQTNTWASSSCIS